MVVDDGLSPGARQSRAPAPVVLLTSYNPSPQVVVVDEGLSPDARQRYTDTVLAPRDQLKTCAMQVRVCMCVGGLFVGGGEGADGQLNTSAMQEGGRGGQALTMCMVWLMEGRKGTDWKGVTRLAF